MSKELVERLRVQWAELDPVDEYRSDAAEAADLIEQQAARIAELERQLSLLKATFVVNMIRAFPQMSHDQVKAEIDAALTTKEES